MKIEDLRIGQTVYHKESGKRVVSGLSRIPKPDRQVTISNENCVYCRCGVDDLSLEPFSQIPESHTHYLSKCGEVVAFPPQRDGNVFIDEVFTACEAMYEQGNTGTKAAMERKRDYNAALTKVNAAIDLENGDWKPDWSSSTPIAYGFYLVSDGEVGFDTATRNYGFSIKRIKCPTVRANIYEQFYGELKTILAYRLG